MGEAIGQLLPGAIGVALSPVPILAVVLMLGTPRARWRGRPKPGETPEIPTWMATIDRFTAGKAAGLGVVLSALNPKNLTLTIAAMAGVAQAGLSAGEDAVAVIVFVVIGSVTVAGPVAAYLLMGRRAEHALNSIKDWMTENNTTIMIVLFLVLGLKIIGDGIAGL